MRPKLQIHATVDVYAKARKDRGRINDGKFRVRAQKRVDYAVILLGQNAAGRINQTPADTNQALRRLKDTALLIAEFSDASRRLAPLEVGIAAQGSKSATGNVEQDPVRLARKTLETRIALAIDDHGMNVGQAAARQAGCELRETLGRYVDCVQAPR